MSGEETPTGSCVCCRRRDAAFGLVCDPDRSRLASWTRDVAEYTAQLLAEDEARTEPTAVREGDVVVRGKYGTVLATTGPREPLSYALPGAPTPGVKAGGRVSGSREASVPIAVDRVDLVAPARRTSARAALDDDAVGHLSVATTLDFWAGDLREHRGIGEAMPDPTVDALASWLLLRSDEACDDWLPVDEFFEDVRRLRGALMAQLGLFDVPDYKAGVPCRSCSTLALVRQPGSNYVECGACPDLLTPEEYEAWVRSLAAGLCGRRGGDWWCARPKRHPDACSPAEIIDRVA
jgi:hypothetical protein